MSFSINFADNVIEKSKTSADMHSILRQRRPTATIKEWGERTTGWDQSRGKHNKVSCYNKTTLISNVSDTSLTITPNYRNHKICYIYFTQQSIGWKCNNKCNNDVRTMVVACHSVFSVLPEPNLLQLSLFC